MNCTHKSHANYSRALEGLYIQTHLATLDLTKIRDEARVASANGGTNDAGTYIYLNDHKVDEVIERLAFGRSELAAAQVIVDRHLASGKCPHLPAEKVAS